MEWKVYDWKSQKVERVGEVFDRIFYNCGFCKGNGVVEK